MEKKVFKQSEILTLINELEEENIKLKDRINELESKNESLYIGKLFCYDVTILNMIKCYNEKGTIMDNVIETTKTMSGGELTNLITQLLKDNIFYGFSCDKNILHIANFNPITNLHHYYTITINFK